MTLGNTSSSTSSSARFRARVRFEFQALRELAGFWRVAWHQLRHSDAEANSNALEAEMEELYG